MKRNASLQIVVLSIVLTGLVVSGIVVPTASAQAQDPLFALQRGYRTGYSDGYMAGYRDTIDSVAKNYSRHTEYGKADRAYSKEYGTIEDYKDGYKQGFESGYDTGYERRSFEASLPKDLNRKGVLVGERMVAGTTTDGNKASTQSESVVTEQNSSDLQSASTPVSSFQNNSNTTIIIPRDTELVLELQSNLNTESTREGEKFTARITAPSEIAGATIEGRVSKVTKPGRLKRHSELVLSFDRIILNDNRWSNFSAQLTEVLAVKGDNVKKVDSEGTAIGQSSLKKDAIKVGGATGAGALIGGLAGGPVGVAIGAGVGAAFGVGAVVINRGKHIKLSQNQQLRIRTAYETQIR